MKIRNRIICCLLAVTTFGACIGCSGNSSDTQSGIDSTDTASGTASSTDASEGTYFATDIWKPVSLVTQEALDMGYTGGEGCQWMTYITFDRTDGTTAYATVDVGGMMKSADGGKTWAQSTVGLDTEGATGVTVDPTNKDRVLVIGGGGSANNSKHGMYLSTDQGFSWTQKQSLAVKGNRDFRRQIAFDESSYDAALGGCKVIYWSTENIAGLEGKGVYKSTDGGETWTLMANSTEYAGCCVAVHPKTGVLYLSNSTGLYKCTDGATFTKTSLSANITYLDTSKSAPDKIFMTAEDDFYVYDTATDTATAMKSEGYPVYPSFISVAPSDANVMVMQSDYQSNGSYHGNKNLYSKDGGKTWTEAVCDYSGSFIPYNQRQNPSSFHPTNPNIVIKLGGDFIMRSEDGGKNYKMSNDGNNAMCIGGWFNFNVNNPNLIAVGSQDYNGGFSIDGGKTWTYINWSGKGWGGMTYGAYCINETSVVVGYSASGWYKGEVEIATTFDGGKTINYTGIMTTGSTIGMGVPGNDDIIFFGDHRSTDGGHTWEKMEGCTGVYTSSADGKLLFGSGGTGGYYIVMSSDNGATWTQIQTTGDKPGDMSYNDKTGKLLVTSKKLFEVDITTGNMTALNVNANFICSVDIDSTNNDIMYVTSKPPGIYANNSVWRSIDGGKTWTCLNRAVGDGREGPDGGRASSFVRIDGEGSAWVISHCRGIWKIARPEI